MSGREEVIKYIEESIRDFKQSSRKQDAYKALCSLYATLDLLKEQKEKEGEVE